MDFSQVQAILNDLPTTFKRRGTPYTQLIDALTSGLLLFTQGSDGLLAQTNFANARYGWVDVWGAIAAIRRRNDESDFVYKPRIQNMILSPRLSPAAIAMWLLLVEQVNATVTESLPSVGYSVVLPPTLTTQQIQNILNTLAWVRPAGVPFQLGSVTGGSFLATVNYLGGAPRTTGAYLPGNSISVGVTLAASTNNETAILPDLLFTDPLLNPSLANGA
jgi:hypothetical protein